MTPLSKCCHAPIEKRGSCQCPTCTKCGKRIAAVTIIARVDGATE